jgi:hypothetical protein
MEFQNQMSVVARGRKPMAALMISEVAVPIEYPDAPYDLTDEEADEWRAIVRSMQPDFFNRGNFPVLSQLCRHICNARRIAQLISACEGILSGAIQPFAQATGHREFGDSAVIALVATDSAGKARPAVADGSAQGDGKESVG